jgi:hypothetical protein
MLIMILTGFCGIIAVCNVLMLVLTLRMIRNSQKAATAQVPVNAPTGVHYLDSRHEQRIASEIDVED